MLLHMQQDVGQTFSDTFAQREKPHYLIIVDAAFFWISIWDWSSLFFVLSNEIFILCLAKFMFGSRDYIMILPVILLKLIRPGDFTFLKKSYPGKSYLLFFFSSKRLLSFTESLIKRNKINSKIFKC